MARPCLSMYVKDNGLASLVENRPRRQNARVASTDYLSPPHESRGYSILVSRLRELLVMKDVMSAAENQQTKLLSVSIDGDSSVTRSN